jgi:monothiol glutaredoxin
MNQDPSKSVQQEIAAAISANKVVLFMKGTPQSPQCGYSASAVKMLSHIGILDFTFVNVLEDSEIREGIKQFSSWPTIPQLYVNGEFVGGADIMREMHDAGELAQLLKDR